MGVGCKEVDTMVSSTTSMVGIIHDDVLTELRGLPDETLTALEGKVKEGLFSVQPFEGLETAYLQK